MKHDYEPPFGVGNIMSPSGGGIQTNSNSFFNLGGTRTPVGGLFQGTGVYAPGRRTGSAPRLPRTVSVETPKTTMKGIPSINISSIVNEALKFNDPRTKPSEEDAAQAIIDGLDGLDGPKLRGPSGPASNPYTDAIRILQQQLSGGQYGTSYDNLSTLLGTTSGTARGQIDQATADAIAQINREDPLATPINYSAGTTQIPQTALTNYLNAIGASTGTVDAGRNFLQGLIDTSASSASQAQASQQQAYAAQRQAAIDALTGNQQLQQSNLATSTQAQQMAIARAKEQERKALEDQILQYVLKGGRA